MVPDAWVFAGESLDFGVGEVATKTHVELAGEVIVEFGEEFDVEEEDGSGGELVGDNVEKDLRAVVFVLFGGALLGANGEEPHFDKVSPVTEEDALAACVLLEVIPDYM